jgi:hypothetical protein
MRMSMNYDEDEDEDDDDDDDDDDDGDDVPCQGAGTTARAAYGTAAITSFSRDGT